MAFWLFKSEPDVFGIEHLKASPKQTTPWDGVRNYQARNLMRDEMRIGDLAFFYHSNCKVPGVIGIMKVVAEAHPDPTQFDPQNKYFDSKASVDAPRWFCVDLKFVEEFDSVIPLEAMKANPALAEMALVRKGNRLSVMPVTESEWEAILAMR
jgi:predicted RNA-binding protein with PUA-like domain